MAIDCHAHVFTRDLPLAGERRYAPDYDATIAQYLAMLDDNGMSHGVLVQPSFLGTDNSYMLEALTSMPSRLRGIAVVAPDIETDALQVLDRQGVVGVRLNLLGRPDPVFTSREWSRHLGDISRLGWQVELQAEAGRLPALLPPLLASGCTVVVDHFGKPDPVAGIDDPGFRYLLSVGKSRQVWVKLSAAYRNGSAGRAIAQAAIPLLKAEFGLDRLVWGSDWPHTQFERVANPAEARQILSIWLPNAAECDQVLDGSPRKLFRFGG
ncbi:amidohydrolase family protein [Telmatospirillum siberiense]|uniref:amidohydrolase family protein n=1 Tax=Telmatospirillum siberiense TaxID=382514 RepID=UPI0018EE20D0|nr:amidohydrolase family protein [Telmatospirillum siberiense]